MITGIAINGPLKGKEITSPTGVHEEIRSPFVYSYQAAHEGEKYYSLVCISIEKGYAELESSAAIAKLVQCLLDIGLDKNMTIGIGNRYHRDCPVVTLYYKDEEIHKEAPMAITPDEIPAAKMIAEEMHKAIQNSRWYRITKSGEVKTV